MGTGYTFFWTGLPIVARRIYGVAFAIRTMHMQNTQESLISMHERLMISRLPLATNRFGTFEIV